jgi:hypothetical protein
MPSQGLPPNPADPSRPPHLLLTLPPIFIQLRLESGVGDALLGGDGVLRQRFPKRQASFMLLRRGLVRDVRDRQ